MSQVLEVKNLTKTYEDFTLDHVSFTLKKGYVMGLIGPNGAGKSTIIKLIMNLIKRDSGQIKVFGMDNILHEKEIKDRIGFVYDESAFYGTLTIDEMKGLIAPFYSNWNEAKFKEYIKDFDLNPKKKIDDLSKGMKMKFSLALALSHNAEFILMDEPTAGLDPVFRSELLDILYTIIQDEDKSIFFSTHITTDLEKIADYITFINRGRLIFSMTKDEVLERYAIVKGRNDLLNGQIEDEFIGIRRTAMGFEALTDDVPKVRSLFKDSVLIERASLDDIMVYSIRRDMHA